MSDVLQRYADQMPPPDGEDEELPERPPLGRNALLPFRIAGGDTATGDPRMQEPPDDGEPKNLLRPRLVEQFARWMAMKNIADEIDDQQRQQLAMQVKREYDIDDTTRADWKDRYRQWLDFAMQIAEPKTYPWPSASNVIFPLITTAALQFNARAYPAIVQGRNVVKGSVVGSDSGIPAIDPQTGQPMMVPIGPPEGQPQQPPAGQQLPGPPGQPAPPMPMQGAPPGQQGQPQQPQMGPAWILPPGAKQERADKIGRHMSWQLLSEQPEWEEETDRLLIVIAVTGTMFRKTYYDPTERRNVSETVDALRLCVNYRVRSFEKAPRITEEIDVYPWEIESNIRSGIWLDYDGGGADVYGRNQDSNEDEQAPVTFLEQHRRWDLDGDGYAEPVIVTIARDSGKLARISLGFDTEGVEAADDGSVQRIEPTRYYTKYGLLPNPEGGAYDLGFGSLMYPLNAAVNSSLNQLFDAGHLQIAGGGFIGNALSMNTGSVRFTMGEYKPVNAAGKSIRENIVPLEWPGPNAVMLSLLQFLVESAREVGSIKDVLTGDMPGANVPGILGLAVIQQGLKVFNAIFKRVHRSLRKDFEKLFRLNRLFMPDEAGFRIGSEYFSVRREDYEKGGGVEPVSNPDMVTDAQQMAQANFLLTFKDDPFFDTREIRHRVLQAAAIAQIDKLLKPGAPPNAEIAASLAALDIQNREAQANAKLVDLREKELNIRAAHQEADQDIRRGKDKAAEIELLTRAIKNLADAVKSDHEVNQGWYFGQLEALRKQIEILNVTSEAEPSGSSPSAVAGISPSAVAPPVGPLGGGVPGMAPPSGVPGAPDVSGGLS